MDFELIEKVLNRLTDFRYLQLGIEPVWRKPPVNASCGEYNAILNNFIGMYSTLPTFLNKQNPVVDGEYNQMRFPVVQLYKGSYSNTLPVDIELFMAPYRKLRLFFLYEPSVVIPYTKATYRRDGYWNPTSGTVYTGGENVGTAESLEEAWTKLRKIRIYTSTATHSVSVTQSGEEYYLVADTIEISIPAKTPNGVCIMYHTNGAFSFDGLGWDSAANGFTDGDSWVLDDPHPVYIPNFDLI